VRNLYRAMISENFLIHALVLALLLCGSIAEKALGVDFSAAMTSLYIVMVAMLLFGKPFSSKNWKWLRTLPISRRKLFAFVLCEALITIAFAVTTLLVLICIRNYKALLQLNLDFVSWERINKFVQWLASGGYVPDEWPYLILFAIVTSPILIFVIQPFNVMSAAKAQTVKSLAVTFFCVLLASLSLFYAPVLTLTIGMGLFLAWTGMTSVSSIFPARRFRAISRAYAGIIFISAISFLITAVEIRSEPATRPALRMKYYSFLAPKVKSSDLLALLELPTISDSARIEIAEFERDRRSDKDLVSADELREWSSKAGSFRVFLQGLVLFENQMWTVPTLVQLENELKNRCKSRIQPSKWAPVWKCDLGRYRLKNGRGPLNISLNVKDSLELQELLSVEHSLLSSMLIQASFNSISKPEWKSQIELLAKSNSPVISNQGQMWLDRYNVNAEGRWDCSSRRRNPASVCSDANMVDRSGLRFESLVVGDPGGSISVRISK